MRSPLRRVSICLACTWVLVIGLVPIAGAAPASPAPLAPATAADIPHVEGTSTVPVYDYAEAIRESVYVETDMDSDADGVADLVMVDIIRPREAAEAGIKVPTVMVASPYYHCCGRGGESERKVYGDDGVPVKFPLYYDNYFVPRGYAIAAVDLAGTARSTGCMDVGGNAEVGSATAAIDWLNGRARGIDLDGNEVSATDWSSGKVGMIGKSWDGSVANGAAATGIDGLETIVPIGAISSWYNYTRASGTIISRGYADYLHRYVSGRPSSACTHIRTELIGGSDDATANYNEFWAERDYVKDADKVKASVFVVHGLGDSNVKMINVGPWWDALAANGVPRKIWLTQTGHEEPFDFRRAEWVDTLHDWFDYWLQGLDNGIMREPMATVEQQSGRYVEEATWPARGSRDVSLNLSGPAEEGRGAMTLRAQPKAGTVSLGSSWGSVLTFSSAELRDAVRLSGTPELTLRVKVDRPTRAIRARLVEHGEDLQVTGSSLQRLDTESCWGASTAQDDACYFDRTPVVTSRTSREVTFGNADIAHWSSLSELTPVEPDQWVDLTFPLNSTDALIDGGNRIAIELRSASPGYTGLSSGGATIEVDLAASSVRLPIAGGLNGLADPGPRPEKHGPQLRPQPSLQELVEDFD